MTRGTITYDSGQASADAEETIRALQAELAETNRGLISLALELEQRVDERTAQLRETHDELQRTNAQLAATNEELEAFSYSVSHDLRAPLRSIDGFSQILLEEYAEKLDDDGKNHLLRVRAATQRMRELIDDLLNLSRVARTEMRRTKNGSERRGPVNHRRTGEDATRPPGKVCHRRGP